MGAPGGPVFALLSKGRTLMALADYHQRDAVAIAQVLKNFDEEAVAAVLRNELLEIAVPTNSTLSSEGEVLADLLVRLAARLYPALSFRGPSTLTTGMRDLAQRINPAVDIIDEHLPPHALTVAIGATGKVEGSNVLYAGSSNWVANVSWRQPQGVGESANPFGAGASAALAMAQAFNWFFLGKDSCQESISLPVLPGRSQNVEVTTKGWPQVVLLGAGAVGGAAIWALSKLANPPAECVIVDPEVVELSNLQRYVLAERADVGISKVLLAKRFLEDATAVQTDWASFVASTGYRHDVVAVSVDSAGARRALQATLPGWIANAWTQPGDLGVSHHALDGRGACLSCLYLPEGQTTNEDAIYAEALGIADQIMQVRILLDRGDPVPDPMLEMIGQRLGVERDAIMAFAGRPIRALYTEGICGGAVLPIGQTGTPRPEVHVPLAHQSALAGIMLGARLFLPAPLRNKTLVSRVNVLGKTDAKFVTQPMAKDPRGICICQDPDYLAAYASKYAG